MKKTLTSALALLLLVGCVLTFIPAEVLASWSVPDATSKTQGVNTSQGNYKVNFRYFAEDMYAPPQGDTVYDFYTYDSTASDNHYITPGSTPINGSTPSTDSTLSDISSLVAFAPTSTTPSGGTLSSSTTAGKCSCTASNHGTWRHSCDHTNTANSISLTFGNYDVSFTIPGGKELSLLRDATEVGTITPFSVVPTTEASKTGTVTSTSTKTAQIVSSISSGYQIIVNVQYTTTYSATVEATRGAMCRDGLLSDCTSGYFYTYSVTDATISTTVNSCTAYVVHEQAEIPSAFIDGEITTGVDGFIPYAFSSVGSADVISLPTLVELVSAKPTTFVKRADETDEQFAIRTKAYESVLYPQGYYQADTLAEAQQLKVQGKQTSFPLTGVNKDITIWVDWATDNPNNNITSKDLNASLSSATSGTFNPYVASASPNDLTNDVSYTNKIFYLSSNVASGVTLNFMLNAGVYDYNAETKLTASSLETPDSIVNVNSSATANVADNTRDYTVALQNDITIDGIVRIGGHTGSRSNQTTQGQGMIIGNYVALDLNGHTLTINGMLHSFGYIYDSVGTGKIIVNPGSAMATQMVPYGLFGGDHTVEAYSMGLCPFEEYNLPYVQARVELITENGSTGTLYTFSSLNLGGLGLSNFAMKLFGNSTKPSKGINTDLGDAMFSVSGTGKIIIDTEHMSNLSSNSLLNLNCYDVKNTFTFEDLTVTFNGVSISVQISISILTADADLEFKRMYFPISPLLDLTFKNSTLNLSQYMVVMPGSTVTFDEGSTLNLTHKVENLSEVKKTVIITIQIINGHNNYALSGGIIALSHSLWTDNVASAERAPAGKYGLVSCVAKAAEIDTAAFTAYWKQFDEAVVNIYGNVSFDTGNTSAYILAGNINISNFKDSSGTVRKWDIANLNATALSGINLVTHGSFIMAATSETGLSTSGTSHIVRVSYYYTEVMKSNGIGYLIDTAAGIYKTGSYDYKDGIFRANDETKYIIIKKYALNAGGKIDNATTAVLITEDLGNEVVTTADKAYVYFGGIYNEITDRTLATSALTDLAADKTNLDNFRAAEDDNDGYSVALKWNATGKYWYRTA